MAQIDIQNMRNRIVGFASTPPDSGDWLKGDIVYNTEPSPGGFIGWVYVDDGESASWKGFGQIETEE